MQDSIIDKIKNYYKRVPWNDLRDLRAIGTLVFVLIVIAISWSGVKAIQTNYGLQKQITSLKQQDQLQQLKNNNLELDNQYYNTNQYLDLSARQIFGLGQPGETELIVPQNVALAHLAKQPSSTTATTKTSREPFYERNFQAWINFVFHRNTND